LLSRLLINGKAIEIREASWSHDELALREIRSTVFIDEQQVPVELEWDEFDDDCAHWLALVDGRPVGTARLLRSGQVGRMAVLRDQRGRGVGAALLSAVIAYAEAHGRRELFLHAQTHALPFYARFGFEASGPEFMEAAIPHQTMRRLLRPRRLGEDGGRFAVRDRAAVALDLARQCTRQLRLYSPLLDHELFDSDAFATALSELARRHRQSEVRLLIRDSRPLVERGHRLLDLARRLSSSVRIRLIDDRVDDLDESYLVADLRGVLCFDNREPESGWADYNNQPLAESFRARFDQLWERAEESADLRSLHL